MMKAKKRSRLIAAFVLLSILVVLIGSAMMYKNEEPSDAFINMCDQFFKGSDVYSALDKVGNDVTEIFYANHLADYESKNYAALRQAVADELSCITWLDAHADVGSNQSVMQRFYQVVQSPNISGKCYEVAYHVAGDYTINEESGEIAELGNAVLNVETNDAGMLCPFVLRNVSTNSYQAAANHSVTFEGSFMIEVDFAFYTFPGMIWGAETIGPFRGSVTGR